MHRLFRYRDEKATWQVGSQPLFEHAHVPPLSSMTPIARFLLYPNKLVRVLIPSFLMHGPADESKANPHSTAYLDGMRGLAAFAVFLCHLSYGTWDTTHVFGAGVLRDNRFVLQLPIVRLICGGPPMVAIFFVISGYVLSYKPVKLMLTHNHEKFMTTMCSAIFRRAIRLFLPCFASTFLVAALCQLGAYKKTEDFAQNMRAIVEEHAWTAPGLLTQLQDWILQMSSFVNVFDWSLYAGSIALDRHLWTIPTEYRCSMALFITQSMTARMSTRMRLSSLFGLIWWGIHWNRWDLIPFWAGSILVEVDLLNGTHSVTSGLDSLFEDKASKVTCRSIVTTQWRFWCVTNFVCGLYLASFPDADGHISPGYTYLNSIIPVRWTEKHRFWPTIGAVQIVWSASRVDFIRHMFSSPLLQYIGRISFSLYVTHGPVIHTFGYMTMSTVYAYTGSDDQSSLVLGFMIAAAVTVVVAIWVADIFWRVVDQPTVRFAKWFEDKMLVS